MITKHTTNQYMLKNNANNLNKYFLNISLAEMIGKSVINDILLQTISNNNLLQSGKHTNFIGVG